MIRAMLFRTIRGYEDSLPFWRRWLFRWKMNRAHTQIAVDMGWKDGDASVTLRYKVVDGITFILEEEVT